MGSIEQGKIAVG